MEQPPHDPPVPASPENPAGEKAEGTRPSEHAREHAPSQAADFGVAAPTLPAPQVYAQQPGYAPPQGYAQPQGYAPQAGYVPPQGYAQPPYPPPPGGNVYRGPVPPFGGYYGAPAPNEGKAVTSLVLGILSMLCLGIVGGIPAIILGVLGKRDIDRSGGALAGGGMANAGIALGALSSLLTIGWMMLALVPLVLGGMSFATSPKTSSGPAMPAPPAYTAPSFNAPAPHSETESSTSSTRGSLKVIEPHHGSGSLERQLIDAFSRAKEKGRGVLVETAAAQSSASREFDSSLSDRRMQRALGGVDLVRVDIEEFAAELSSMSMYTEAVPYFYKIDAAARPTDAISADEWDDNIPQNMAPVLESFVAGTLRKRRNPSPLGTNL